MEAKPQNYSITRVNLAQECEYKYYLKYVKKHYPSTSMSFFLVGRVVHEVIENFFKTDAYKAEVLCVEALVKAELLKSISETSYQKLVAYVDFCFASKLAALLLYENQKGKSATNIKLTRLWKDQFLVKIASMEKEVNEFVENDTSDIIWYTKPTAVFCTIFKCLENFLDFFRDDLTFEESKTEHEFKIPAGEIAGHRVMGIIDRLTWKEMEFDLLDYKTGKQRHTEATVGEDAQTSLYAWLVYELTDTIPGKATIWDLLHNKQVTSTINFEQLDKFIKDFTPKLEYAASLYESQKGKTEEELTFKVPDYNWQCKACEYAHSPKGCKFDRNKKDNK